MSENVLTVLLGQNIAIQRKRLGISQKDLAERLEISSDAMIRIEKGRIAPKMGRMQDIANKLNCSVSYLFRTDEEQTSERGNEIAKLIEKLPPHAQEAIIDLVATSVKVMTNEFKNEEKK